MSDKIRLDGPFAIRITGDTADVARGLHISPEGLWYILGRLMTGQSADVSELNLSTWSLQIEDESDGLAVEP